jgi:MYXO-CTERM domain-containing protein
MTRPILLTAGTLSLLLAGCIQNEKEEIISSAEAICCGASCCFIDGDCRTRGQRNPANACEECNPSMSQNVWSPVANCMMPPDAGPPPIDAGAPDLGMMGPPDMGAPPAMDAGPAPQDASVAVDAGTPPAPDASAPPPPDASAPPADSGVVSGRDATPNPSDAGSSSADAGEEEEDSGCACVSSRPKGSSLSIAALLLAAAGLVLRRRR